MKPILFNTEMVRAILEGRKTVTRRVVKPRYIEGEAGYNVVTDKYTGEFRYIETYDEDERGTDRRVNPPYRIGELLYVRESWGDYRENCEAGEGPYYLYRADFPDDAKTYQYPDGPVCDLPRWHPSIHMPKEAARIFLRVTDVKVEQLRDITQRDAEKEGFYTGWRLHGRGSCALSPRQAFMWFWETMTRDGPASETWACNPWVWVIEFERCEKPEL